MTPSEVSDVKPSEVCSCHTKYCCDENIANQIVNKRDKPYIDTNLCTELINFNKTKKINKSWNTVKFKKKNDLVLLSQSSKPTIVLKANNKPMSCLLDSGSDRCLIKYSTLLNFDDKPEICKSDVVIKGVNGKSNVIGETDLSIKIPDCDQIFSCKALVLKDMNFSGHCLIGRDILNDTGAVIDFQENKVIIQGIPIPFCQAKEFLDDKKAFHESDCLLALTCNKRQLERRKIKEDKKRNNISQKPKAKSQPDSYVRSELNNESIKREKVVTANVHISSDVEIPSSSITVIYGHVKVLPGNYLLERNIDSKRGIMIAESLIKIDGNRRVPITITNMNTENVLIPEGTMIAKIVELSDKDIEEQYIMCESMLTELTENNSYKSALRDNHVNSNSLNSSGNSCQKCMIRTRLSGGGTISERLEGHIKGRITSKENCCHNKRDVVNKVVTGTTESEIKKNMVSLVPILSHNDKTNRNNNKNDDNRKRGKYNDISMYGPHTDIIKINDDKTNINQCTQYGPHTVSNNENDNFRDDLTSTKYKGEYYNKNQYGPHIVYNNEETNDDLKTQANEGKYTKNDKYGPHTLCNNINQSLEFQKKDFSKFNELSSTFKGEYNSTKLQKKEGDKSNDQNKLSTFKGEYNSIKLQKKEGDKYNDQNMLYNREVCSFCSNANKDNKDQNKVSIINVKDLNLEENIDEETLGKFEKLINDFRDIFSKQNEPIGKTSILKHNIKLKNPDEIINVVPYRVPYKYQALLDIELKNMKDAGIIRDSISPFNSPVIVVKKKDGTIRPVIDYRRLNKNTIIDSFALPNINEILNSLGGAKVFTTLDIKSAFHHIELEEHCKKYTAFSVNNHKFEFESSPFGLSTSPSVYQALMSRTLNNSLGRIAFCYIDDICIFSKDTKQHLEDLKEVFAKLKFANLKIKLEKCYFLKSKVKYLGHVISDQGITFENNFKLQDTPVPRDAKNLQQFLGLANYYRKFVPFFSSVASPLYNLLKKDTKFDWTERCQTAFDTLKKLLCTELCLKYPNYDKEFYLFTDASSVGVGAVLMQSDENGDLRPLSFFSKTLSFTQIKYSTTKREALGLVLALQHYKYIITDYPVVVMTDHRPLVSLFKNKLPTDTALARWCLLVQSYQIDLKYFAGKLNVVADFLSRVPQKLTTKDVKNFELLVEHKALDTSNDEDVDNFETCVLLNETTKSDRVLFNYLPKLEEVSWTIDELRDSQQKDDYCSIIIDQLRGKFSPDANHIVKNLNEFFMLGDILYKKRNIDNNNLETVNVVIPSNLLQKAIKAVHYNIHCDHVHTLFKFRFRYFHPFENRYIKEFVSNCHVCKLIKGRLPKPIKLKTAPLPSRPFETVSMDFVGPLITTDGGNKYILSVIDLFSRFCVLEALPTKNSDEVIKTLRRIFNNFGYPNTLISDNALEFTSAALNCFTTLHSIKKTEVLTYSAWSNGIVERNNAKITNLLKLYINTMDDSWDMFLDTVANCINNTLNESLKETPAYVLFNYDTLPNLQRENLNTIYNYDSIENLVKLREIEAAKVLKLISNNLSDSIIKSHRRKNANRKNRVINIGDRVFIKNNNKRHKLDLNYLGPGIVTASNNHKLSIKIGNKLYEKVNINHVLNFK